MTEKTGITHGLSFLNVSDSGAMQKDRPGILYALLAAILFGLYSLLQKYVTSTGHIYSQLICTAFAVFLSAIIYLLIREKSIGCIKDAFKKKNVMGLLAGILFFGASFFTVQAYKLLPGSVAFTIIQLNSVWTVLVGIIIFREISFRKHWIRIMAGIFAAIGGVIMLLMAQN